MVKNLLAYVRQKIMMYDEINSKIMDSSIKKAHVYWRES